MRQWITPGKGVTEEIPLGPSCRLRGGVAHCKADRLHQTSGGTPRDETKRLPAGQHRQGDVRLFGEGKLFPPLQ